MSLLREGSGWVADSVTTTTLDMTLVYGWQRFYEEAMLETKNVELPRVIRAANAAIDARLQQLMADPHDSSEERQAIADAQVGLRVLSREFTEG